MSAGLPFSNNSFDVAAMIACQTAAHRRKFVAAIVDAANNSFLGPNGGLNLTLREQAADGTLVNEKTAVVTRDDLDDIVALSETLKKNELPRPWSIAEFLITICVRSGTQTQRAKALAETILDDLEDEFQSDCQKVGVTRARIRYLSGVAINSWPFIQRTIPRLLKWAAIISLVKRMFSG
jgi:hypothetical protein